MNRDERPSEKRNEGGSPPTQSWLEKNCPGLLRDIEFWSAEGASRVHAAGSPCCFACGARLNVPEGIAPPGVVLRMLLCTECSEGLGEEGVELLLRAFRTGSCKGAEWQQKYDAAMLESSQRELLRIHKSSRELLLQVAEVSKRAQLWKGRAGMALILAGVSTVGCFLVLLAMAL